MSVWESECVGERVRMCGRESASVWERECECVGERECGRERVCV